MAGNRILTSYFRPKPGSQAPDSGLNRVEPQPSKPMPKEGQPPLGPSLQRVGSNPARLPSKTPERPEVKPARPSITRTEPDNYPPMHFGRSPARAKVLGIPLPFRKTSTIQGAKLKEEHLVKSPYRFRDIEPTVMRDHPDLMEIVREHSPNYDSEPAHLRAKAMNDALKCHPKYLAIRLHHLNATHRQPTVATATRTMTPGEQTFLTNAFQKISEDVRKNPFHIHGESAVIGNKKGEITYFHHESEKHVDMPLAKGDKYNVHTHPPLWEPATSAASIDDHTMAACYYFEDNKKNLSYVTNGKDVLHIQPDSMELVKLIPDPKMEETLGKFPVAFTVPKPQDPPYPFSNHEAPGALKSGRLKRNPGPTE